MTYWQRQHRLRALKRVREYFLGLKHRKGAAREDDSLSVGDFLSHTHQEPLRCRCVRPDGRDRQTPAPDHFTDCPHSALWATTRPVRS